MTPPIEAHPPPVSQALRRDLALVLPEVTVARSTTVQAYARGAPVALGEAVSAAGALLAASGAPVICGLSMLTLEAGRQIVALSRRTGAALLPWPPWASAAVTAGPIHTATLGHVYGCDLVLEIGFDSDGAEHPIRAAIAERVPHVLRSDAGGADVQTQLRTGGALALAQLVGRPVQRLAALLPAEAPPPVRRQWHEVAAECQQQLRLCVLVLPDLTIAGNQRGLSEVIAWQTGGLPVTGASDLAAADLLIEAGLAEVDLDRPPGARRICIGQRPDDAADLSFVTPGLALGLAARVMRCDGVVLWLCDDPAAAPPDPCVGLLARLTACTAEPT